MVELLNVEVTVCVETIVNIDVGEGSMTTEGSPIELELLQPQRPINLAKRQDTPAMINKDLSPACP